MKFDRDHVIRHLAPWLMRKRNLSWDEAKLQLAHISPEARQRLWGLRAREVQTLRWRTRLAALDPTTGEEASKLDYIAYLQPTRKS